MQDEEEEEEEIKQENNTLYQSIYLTISHTYTHTPHILILKLE